MKSIQKTIKTFCRANQIDIFTIVELVILKSTDGQCLGAELTCVCSEKVKVYMTYRNNSITWVTSSMVRHLSKHHTPNNSATKMTTKITKFLSVRKSNPQSAENAVNVQMIDVDDTTEKGPAGPAELIDEIIDLNNVEFIYEDISSS